MPVTAKCDKRYGHAHEMVKISLWEPMRISTADLIGNVIGGD